MIEKKTYRKSTRSISDEGCIEVSNTLDSARDSKHPKIELTFAGAGLRVFVDMTKSDAFTL